MPAVAVSSRTAGGRHGAVTALLLCAVAVTNAAGAAGGIQFVRSLDYDATTGYLEMHESACTRAGLQATSPFALLSTKSSAPALWNAATALAATLDMGDASLVSPVVMGCCANTMYCIRPSDPSAGYQCGIHGVGSLWYANVGWSPLNLTLTPVYSCTQPAGGAATASAATLASALPIVGNASFVTDPENYVGVRLRVDGANLNTSTPALSAHLQVYAGGMACRDVETCHDQCAPCTGLLRNECGEDKMCVSFSTAAGGAGSTHSFCLRQCDTTNPARNSCPCGGKCLRVSTNGADSQPAFEYFCVNPSFSAEVLTSLCATGELGPPPGAQWPQRLECTPTWPVVLPGGTSAIPPPAWYPYLPGPGVAAVVRSSGVSDPRGSRLLVRDGDPGLSAPRNSAGEGGSEDAAPLLLRGGAGRQWSGATGGGSGGHPAARRAQAATPSSPPSNVAATTSLGGASSSFSGYRYGGVCPYAGGWLAGAPGNVSVIVVINGWASSGLDAGLAASLGLSEPVVPGLFGGLGYNGGAPVSVEAPGHECVQHSDCAIVDLCTLPLCLAALGGPGGPLVHANASFPGCCTYAPTDRCTSAEPAPSTSGGFKPTAHTYVLLPREVAAAVALPPPPVGGVADQDPNSPEKTIVADMSRRLANVNPTAFSWDAGAVWYADLALPEGGYAFGNYAQQPLSSSATPAAAWPPDAVTLSFNVTLWGQASSQLFVSPYGYFRLGGSSVCVDAFGSPDDTLDGSCGFYTDYAGLVGPLVAQFAPGDYDDSEVYAGFWDAKGVSAAPLASLPSSQVACVVWLNMGLYGTSGGYPGQPPSPSFSFSACVHGDGGVRWRTGQVFGVPGYTVGGWSSSDPVSPFGGPPNTSSAAGAAEWEWLAGIRSASSPAAALTSDWVHSFAPVLGASDAGGASDFSASGGLPGPGDVAVSSPAQLLLTRAGARQSTTAVACALRPIACASPACGSTATVVTLSWGTLGCGLGFDVLGLVGGAGSATAVPRVECTFGGIASLATLTALPSGSNPLATWTCAAPDRAGFAGGLGNASSAFSVPLRLQLIAPTSAGAFAPANRPGAVYAPALSPNPFSGAGDPAPVLLGAGASGGSPTSPTAVVPLDVYGVEQALPAGCAAAAGCARAFLVPTILQFTYRALGDASPCGCSAADSAAACDACGVCGGGGNFVDCAGACFGAAFVDECSDCTGGGTGVLPNAAMDCEGVCGGSNRGCYTAPSPSPSPDPSPTITIIVISGLVVCSFALLLMIAYFAAVAVQRRNSPGGSDPPLTLEDMGIPRGLSEASRSRIPVVAYHPQRPEFLADAEHDVCTICIQKYVPGEPVRVLPPCKHAFHVACVDEWLDRSTQCPVCRRELRSEEEVAEVEAARQRLQTAARTGVPPVPVHSPAQRQQQRDGWTVGGGAEVELASRGGDSSGSPERGGSNGPQGRLRERGAAPVPRARSAGPGSRGSGHAAPPPPLAAGRQRPSTAGAAPPRGQDAAPALNEPERGNSWEGAPGRGGSDGDRSPANSSAGDRSPTEDRDRPHHGHGHGNRRGAGAVHASPEGGGGAVALAVGLVEAPSGRSGEASPAVETPHGKGSARNPFDGDDDDFQPKPSPGKGGHRGVAWDSSTAPDWIAPGGGHPPGAAAAVETHAGDRRESRSGHRHRGQLDANSPASELVSGRRWADENTPIPPPPISSSGLGSRRTHHRDRQAPPALDGGGVGTQSLSSPQGGGQPSLPGLPVPFLGAQGSSGEASPSLLAGWKQSIPPRQAASRTGGGGGGGGGRPPGVPTGGLEYNSFTEVLNASPSAPHSAPGSSGSAWSRSGGVRGHAGAHQLFSPPPDEAAGSSGSLQWQQNEFVGHANPLHHSLGSRSALTLPGSAPASR